VRGGGGGGGGVSGGVGGGRGGGGGGGVLSCCLVNPGSSRPSRRVLLTAPSAEAAHVFRRAMASCIFTLVVCGPE